MKLYHATKEENLASIQDKGLLPTLGILELTEEDKKTNLKHGYVYLTDSLKASKTFGEIVLVINSDNLNPKLLKKSKEGICYSLGVDYFYNYKGVIPFDIIEDIIFT